MSILFYHILFYTVLFCFYNIFCSIQSILFYLSILFCSALVYSVLFCSSCSSVVHHNCLAGYGYSHALWSVLEQSILFLWSYENCPPLFFLAHMGTNAMWGSFMVSFLFWGGPAILSKSGNEALTQSWTACVYTWARSQDQVAFMGC